MRLGQILADLDERERSGNTRVSVSRAIVPHKSDSMGGSSGSPSDSVSGSSGQEGEREWGVYVPDDRSHTVYVWLDALTAYLTGK